MEVTENDVKLARIIRNGILVGVLGILALFVSCNVANWHYESVNAEIAAAKYMAVRPW